MSPLISVIMPVYNGERYISAALDSILIQDALDVETVIIDDGSTDRTLEIARSYADKMPIRLITPGRIGNWTLATNLGLQNATAEWACFLHADDIWFPGRISELRETLAHTDATMVLHNASFISPNGAVLGPWTCPLPSGIVSSELFLEHLLVQNFVAICSPTFCRATANQLGGLDKDLWHTADWDLWLKLGTQGPVHFISKTLAAFRVHPESQTVARQITPGEWKEQLTIVFDRYFPKWSGTGRVRENVRRTASASFAVNSALASAARGEPLKWGTPTAKLLALGPLGWRRYLRDSRIFERVVSRLKINRRAATRS